MKVLVNIIVTMSKNETASKVKCDICHRKYANICSHKATALKKTLQCSQCEEIFAYKNSLDDRVGRKHLVLRNVPCSQCTKYFYSKHDLKDHITQVHQEERGIPIRRLSICACRSLSTIV